MLRQAKHEIVDEIKQNYPHEGFKVSFKIISNFFGYLKIHGLVANFLNIARIRNCLVTALYCISVVLITTTNVCKCLY